MLRNVVKYGAKALGVELRHYSVFQRAIHILAREGPKPYFLQVGANNGIDFDDLFGIVTAYDLHGIVVEPIPYYFEALAQAYKRHRGIVPVRAALHPTDQHATIYRADPEKLKLGWQHGLGSFSRDHLLRNGVAEEAIIPEQVPCMSLAQTVERYAPSRQSIDVLVSDTEGFDAEIIAMIDFARVSPKVIKFESKHLNSVQQADVNALLIGKGFVVEKGAEDWVAVKKELASRVRFFRSSVR